MGSERRIAPRVDFESGIGVYIMGIDGTWRRECLMKDVSASGVLLMIKDPIAGLDIREFFLLLSSTGLAYRRCQMVRLNGNQIAARFLKPEVKKKSGRMRPLI
jgi:hypothetical protein